MQAKPTNNTLKMFGYTLLLLLLHIPAEWNPQTFSVLNNAQASHGALSAIYSLARALSAG
jgi:hypothetical protein